MNFGSELDRRMARLAGLIGDQYEFLSLLGEGGAGRVYEVRNRHLDRREALKILSDTFQEAQASERFTHEAKVAASLQHPGIVQVHSFGQLEGIHWFSMQLVDGPSLAAVLEAQHLLSLPELMGLALPILDALTFSHQRGVVHRDIKPANILIGPDGRPLLTDFGVAKTDESTLQTRTGQLLGTPAYVAPEQALGQPVDARADQYSLGITFYKALTGRLPFSSDNVLQTLVLRLKEDPEPIQNHRPDLPPEICGIIMRSLAKDRSDRWPRIEDMKAALQAYGASTGATWERSLADLTRFPLVRTPLHLPLDAPAEAGRGSFEPTLDLPPPVRTKPDRRLWYAGAGLALILVLGGLAYWRMTSGIPSVQAETPVTPAVAAPVPTTPSPSAKPNPTPTPASGVKSPKPGVTASPQLAPPVRRPVTYPQLIEGAPVSTSATSCQGLKVNVSVLVGEDGTVKACNVLSSVKPECAEAARAAALRYRFKPALDAQGLPLETRIAAAVDFPETP